MVLPLLILRPEPGASQTVARARAAGLTTLAVPLFSAGPVEWTPPEAAGFDALLLSSANAPRFAADALSAFAPLPLYCVGEATAAAARTAGLVPVHCGDGGADTVISKAHDDGMRRLLWLAGVNRSRITAPADMRITAISVYQAHPLPVDPARLSGPAVAMLHSKRAARRLAALSQDPATLRIVAISSAVADAAGPGWAAVRIASRPDDSEMVAIAAKLCHEDG